MEKESKVKKKNKKQDPSEPLEYPFHFSHAVSGTCVFSSIHFLT